MKVFTLHRDNIIGLGVVQCVHTINIDKCSLREKISLLHLGETIGSVTMIAWPHQTFHLSVERISLKIQIR